MLVRALFNIEINFLCQNNSKFITLPVNVKTNTKFIDLTFKNDNWRNHQKLLLADDLADKIIRS